MGACEEVREQFRGVGSFFPPRGSQGLNSGPSAWWQALLSAEPPHPPFSFVIVKRSKVLGT